MDATIVPSVTVSTNALEVRGPHAGTRADGTLVSLSPRVAGRSAGPINVRLDDLMDALRAQFPDKIFTAVDKPQIRAGVRVEGGSVQFWTEGPGYGDTDTWSGDVTAEGVRQHGDGDRGRKYLALADWIDSHPDEVEAARKRAAQWHTLDTMNVPRDVIDKLLDSDCVEVKV